MGRGRRLLSPARAVLLAVLVSSATGAARADEAAQSAPATSAPVDELPESVRDALRGTTDFAFNFDQPGFFAVVDFVRRSPRSPGFAQQPIVVSDWSDLVERPGEFRGLAVTIEGTVGRNKVPYTLTTHPELGMLSQLELRSPGQATACTLICTEDASTIPLGARLTATGYFVLARQYRGTSGRDERAVLLVTPGPTVVTRPAPLTLPAGVIDWRWILAALASGLLLAWIVLRWATRGGGRSHGPLRARHAAPLNLADDLSAWAEDERDFSTSQDDHPASADEDADQPK